MSKEFVILISIEEESGKANRICQELELGRFETEEEAQDCLGEILEDAGYDEELDEKKSR
jgi:hypothetical protein